MAIGSEVLWIKLSHLSLHADFRDCASRQQFRSSSGLKIGEDRAAAENGVYVHTLGIILTWARFCDKINCYF